MRSPVIVLTTVGATFDPRPLAQELVEKRLAACINILPQIHSVYRWQGKIENDSEQLLLIKTVDERLDSLKEALFARHPYEVPEFVVVPIASMSEAYGKWLLDAVKGESGATGS